MHFRMLFSSSMRSLLSSIKRAASFCSSVAGHTFLKKFVRPFHPNKCIHESGYCSLFRWKNYCLIC